MRIVHNKQIKKGHVKLAVFRFALHFRQLSFAA